MDLRQKGMLSDSSWTKEDRDALRAKEHQFYVDHPPSSLNLTPTEFTSPYGMPVYKDQFGQNHSESTNTFPIPIPWQEAGKWISPPMIWPDPQTGEARYFTERETIGLLGEHDWENPITRTKIPMFNTEPEASAWAVDRDITLQDKKLPFNR